MGKKTAGSAMARAPRIVFIVQLVIIASLWVILPLGKTNASAQSQVTKKPAAQGTVDIDALRAELEKTTKDAREAEAKARESADQVKRLVDAYDREASRSQQLLLILAGVGSVFAVVQGFLGYRTVETVTTQAKERFESYEKSLEKYEKDLARSNERLRHEWPALGELDTNLRQWSSEISRLSMRVGMIRNRYDRLTPAERAHIEYLETFLPVMELTRLKGHSELVEVLLRLSTYHVAKAKWLSQVAEDLPATDPTAVMFRSEANESTTRADLLLRRAEAQAGSPDHRVLNEIAFRIKTTQTNDELTAVNDAQKTLYRNKRWEQAKKLFLKSLEIHPLQQCALYNLAWFDDEEGNLKLARQRLEKAMEIGYWEYEGDYRDARSSSVQYNLACCLCKLSRTETVDDTKVKLLALAFNHLEACVNAYPEERRSLPADLKSTGDLYALVESEEFNQPVQELLARVQKSF